jgi:hypothetical protein
MEGREEGGGETTKKKKRRDKVQTVRHLGRSRNSTNRPSHKPPVTSGDHVTGKGRKKEAAEREGRREGPHNKSKSHRGGVGTKETTKKKKRREKEGPQDGGTGERRK